MKTISKNRANGSADLARLCKRIGAVRSRHQRVTLAHGFAVIVGAVSAWLTMEMALDWQIDLPWIVRACLLPAAACGLLYVAWTRIIFPLWHRPDDEAVALMVERANPVFRTRFIASIQLAGKDLPGTSGWLVRDLLAATALMADRLDLRNVVKTDGLKRALKLTAGVVAASVAILVFGDKPHLLLLERVFLSNEALPRKTHIVSSGNATIGIGDDLKIEATAEGVIPASGTVTVKYVDGTTHEFTMEPDPKSRGHFSRVIQSVQESFTYTLRLNDATSPVYHVTVLTRPLVTRIECVQIYPEYTQLGQVHRDVGDLKLLAGSRLQLKISASATIKKAVIHTEGVEKEIPLNIDQKNRRELTGALDIPAKDLTGFSISLVDDNGVKSRGDAIHRIDIVQDQPPTIKITQPERQEELITQQGSMVIGFDAADDFGISKIDLHYKIGDDENASVKTIPFDVGREISKTVSRSFEWKIKTLLPTPVEGTVIEYWLEVNDTNTFTGPGVAATEHYQLKVVSDADMRAYIAGRVTEIMEGVHGVNEQQDNVNLELQPLIFEKPGENK